MFPNAVKDPNSRLRQARRTKNVINESKDVITELGDVVDAAKGKPSKHARILRSWECSTQSAGQIHFLSRRK